MERVTLLNSQNEDSGLFSDAMDSSTTVNHEQL